LLVQKPGGGSRKLVCVSRKKGISISLPWTKRMKDTMAKWGRSTENFVGIHAGCVTGPNEPGVQGEGKKKRVRGKAKLNKEK